MTRNDEAISTALESKEVPQTTSASDLDEKEVAPTKVESVWTDLDDPAKVYVPDENEEFIDPRLADYPEPLVAKTVDLHNDFSEPILTFRFWVLSTFWVTVGCAITTMYFFKPYYQSLSSYAVQLLAWGMGESMARYLPKKNITILGRTFSLNPGKWNAKEHALIIVAYWGSCYTAYGLGPLTALELHYDRKLNPGWAIMFLLTSQMIGYGTCGLFRDILVRPPKIYYPGVLPNVALFNAMHKNPAVTKKSLTFFAYVAVATFVWQWIPGVMFPFLSSIPLVCYMAHGQWKGFLMGSGTYGFGILDISFDWNYISFLSPLYTPLWAQLSGIVGAFATVYFLYPLMYFNDVLGAKTFPAMNAGTFDKDGNKYNVTRVLTPQYTLNQTAMDEYSRPYWSASYAMVFWWGFACSSGSLFYAIYWYGADSWASIKLAWKGRRSDYNDPYLKLMDRCERVPHWWYVALLLVCLALSLATIYQAEMGLPWYGLLVIGLIAFVETFPNGILWGVANMQVGMTWISEILAGAWFQGNPTAVLTCMVYGRQILEQNLNLISDYKFGFYMKIPEKEMFIAQVWGTLLGPFVNYGVMRLVIDGIGKDILTGTIKSNAWLAVRTRNYYSISVLWGILGPRVFFSESSPYRFLYWGFLLGPAVVTLVYLVHRWKPHWKLETRCNPVVIMSGATTFPVYPTSNLFTSAMVAIFFMGYMLRYHGAWFRKYNYLLGTGLDCGTQICQTIIMFGLNLPDVTFPTWWGNNPEFPDQCYPPLDLPEHAM